jgi:hypothetical protein
VWQSAFDSDDEEELDELKLLLLKTPPSRMAWQSTEFVAL